jgi:hypothetical protein
MGNHHRELWRLLQRGLTGEAVAKIVIHEIERLERGEAALWSDVEIERMKQPLARDGKARHAYARLINRWCQAHGIDMSLEETDPPSEIALSMSVRWFLLDHAETDIPASTPEQAYQAFTAWQPAHGSYTMALDAFIKHFIQERRSLKGHLKGLHPVYGPAGQILAPAVVDP